MRIWESAYAAAFVAEFEGMLRHSTEHPYRHSGGTERELPFDTAMRTTTAERACTIADAAVREYERWRLQECAGEPVMTRILSMLDEEEDTDELA